MTMLRIAGDEPATPTQPEASASTHAPDDISLVENYSIKLLRLYALTHFVAESQDNLEVLTKDQRDGLFDLFCELSGQLRDEYNDRIIHLALKGARQVRS